MGTFHAFFRRQFELFTTLQHRDFRLFWIGLVAEVTGQQMTMVTLGWLVFNLTGSPLVLGYVNLAQAMPIIVLSLLGGALADRMDRRHLIIISQTVTAVVLAIFTVLTVTGRIEVWHLILGSFLLGLVRPVDEPSRQALFPHLLPDRSCITAAVPLMSMAWQVNRLLAPSIAGFLIAAVGASVSFALAAASAATMITMVRLLHVQRVTVEHSGNVMSNIVEGVRYAWSHMAFRVIISLSFFNSMFAMGYMLMLPVFADAVYHVGPDGLGLMYSAIGLGSVTSLFFVSQLMRFLPVRSVIIGGVIGFLAAVIGFALTPWFVAALFLLAVVGFCQYLFLNASQIVLQTQVPDELRGRVMGLYGMLWSFTSVGGALLNATANFIGAPAALVAGGAVVLAFMLLVVLPNRALHMLGTSAGPTP